MPRSFRAWCNMFVPTELCANTESVWGTNCRHMLFPTPHLVSMTQSAHVSVSHLITRYFFVPMEQDRIWLFRPRTRPLIEAPCLSCHSFTQKWSFCKYKKSVNTRGCHDLFLHFNDRAACLALWTSRRHPLALNTNKKTVHYRRTIEIHLKTEQPAVHGNYREINLFCLLASATKAVRFSRMLGWIRGCRCTITHTLRTKFHCKSFVWKLILVQYSASCGEMLRLKALWLHRGVENKFSYYLSHIYGSWHNRVLI